MFKCAQGNGTSLELECVAIYHRRVRVCAVCVRSVKSDQQRGCLVSGRGRKYIAGHRCRGGCTLNGWTGKGVLKEGGG